MRSQLLSLQQQQQQQLVLQQQGEPLLPQVTELIEELILRQWLFLTLSISLPFPLPSTLLRPLTLPSQTPFSSSPLPGSLPLFQPFSGAFIPPQTLPSPQSLSIPLRLLQTLQAFSIPIPLSQSLPGLLEGKQVRGEVPVPFLQLTQELQRFQKPLSQP